MISIFIFWSTWDAHTVLLSPLEVFSSLAGGLCSSRARSLTPPCVFPQIPQLLPLRHSQRAAPDFPSRGDKVMLKNLVAWGFDCLGMWLIVKVNKIFDTALPALLRSCLLQWVERAQSTEPQREREGRDFNFLSPVGAFPSICLLEPSAWTMPSTNIKFLRLT